MNVLKDPLLRQQAERLEIGRKGEAWVTGREKDKLAGTQYAGSVEISSDAQRSSFDIKSRTNNGGCLYIEVKSTDGNPEAPIYMSADEYAFAKHCMEHSIPYELHRVHHVYDDDLRDEIVYTAEEVVNLFDKVPASYILKQKPTDTETHPGNLDYLPWEDCADRIPGTICKIYLAKIEGPHPEYRFNRNFLKGKFEYQGDRIWFSCEIESTGVYEVSMKWINEEGRVLQRRQDWFMLVDGTAYDLEIHDVLKAVNYLNQKAA